MPLLPVLLALALSTGSAPKVVAVVRPEAGGAAAARGVVELAQLRIEQRVIMRIPMPLPPRPPAVDRPPPPEIEWEEGGKGPRCVPIRALHSASVATNHAVDLILRDRSRLRAKLGHGCRAADFYAGFYVQPTEDGSLCSDRDELLARSGASCEITGFRWLEPRRP